MKWIIRERSSEIYDFNAGSKARSDIDSILQSLGYKPLYLNSDTTEYNNFFKKLLAHISKYKAWEKLSFKLKKGDCLFVQMPSFNHTVFMKLIYKRLNKKGVMTIGIIHDLESLRHMKKNDVSILTRIRNYLEEIVGLKYIDYIIVHNTKMKKHIHAKYKIPNNKLINLKIFDYLYNSRTKPTHYSLNKPVIVAGNLSVSKSGYVYRLPNNYEYNLYGGNYEDSKQQSKKVHYMGKVDPDELPRVLDGSFGLVWDGPNSDTCSGYYGEYLKFNNPHKTSLYIASGLPVIIWSQAALADFVNKNGIGITVNNLSEIGKKISSLSEDDYNRMINNTNKISERIRCGYYLIEAMNTIH